MLNFIIVKNTFFESQFWVDHNNKTNQVLQLVKQVSYVRSGCPAGQFVYVDVLVSDQEKVVAFGCIWQDKVVHFCEKNGSDCGHHTTETQRQRNCLSCGYLTCDKM